MGLPYLALPTAKGREKKDATNPVRKVERDGAAQPAAVGRTPCSGHRHVLREEAPLPVTGTGAHKCRCCRRVFCSPGSFCTRCAGRFREPRPCVRSRTEPPGAAPALTCRSSRGSLSAAARVAPGSQWWIRDTWSQPGLPGAARRLSPAAGREKRKKRGFWGARMTVLPAAVAHEPDGCVAQAAARAGAGRARQAGRQPCQPQTTASHPDPLPSPNPSAPTRC